MSEPTQNLPTAADPPPGLVAFDYGAMDADLARDARAVVERHRARTKAYVLDTGRDLISVKERLGHGNYLPWLRAEMGLEPRTAQNFTLAAERLGAKSEIVSHLPPTVLYKLAAAPEPVREGIVRRIEEGEPIAPEAILAEVDKAREAAKAGAAADRESARRAKLTDDQRADEDALRAKGEKGRAARDRKVGRERAERQEEQRQHEARVAEAARIYVDMTGAEKVAFFAHRYHDVLHEVPRAAEDEAHRRRARAVEPVEVPVNEICRFGALYGWTGEEDRLRVEALAAEIERDGLKESPIMIRTTDKVRPYRVIEGIDTVRALADVLHRPVIPARVAPPVQEVPLTAPAALKPDRPTIGIRTGAPKDHFGSLRGSRLSTIAGLGR